MLTCAGKRSIGCPGIDTPYRATSFPVMLELKGEEASVRGVRSVQIGAAGAPPRRRRISSPQPTSPSRI